MDTGRAGLTLLDLELFGDPLSDALIGCLLAGLRGLAGDEGLAILTGRAGGGDFTWLTGLGGETGLAGLDGVGGLAGPCDLGGLFLSASDLAFDISIEIASSREEVESIDVGRDLFPE